LAGTQLRRILILSELKVSSSAERPSSAIRKNIEFIKTLQGKKAKEAEDAETISK